MLTEPILAAVANACTDAAPCPKCVPVGCIGHPATITGMKLPILVELAELAAEFNDGRGPPGKIVAHEELLEFDGGRGPPGRIEAIDELLSTDPPVEVLAAEPIVLAGALLAVVLLVAVLFAAALLAVVLDAAAMDEEFIAAGIGTCAAASAGLNIDVCVLCDPVAELAVALLVAALLAVLLAGGLMF